MKVKYSGRVMVGLASRSTFLHMEQSLYNVPGSYYLLPSDGIIFPTGQKYCDPLPQSAVLELVYNREEGTIAFSVDGVPKGVAFNHVAHVDNFCVAVLLSRAGEKAEILTGADEWVPPPEGEESASKEERCSLM